MEKKDKKNRRDEKFWELDRLVIALGYRKIRKAGALVAVFNCPDLWANLRSQFFRCHLKT